MVKVDLPMNSLKNLLGKNNGEGFRPVIDRAGSFSFEVLGDRNAIITRDEKWRFNV